MRMTANKIAKRENADLEALDKFGRIYKTQANSISRRLLGTKDKAKTRAVAYLTEPEMLAVKGLADSIGINVSTLIRLTMVELAAAFIPQHDPRLD